MGRPATRKVSLRDGFYILIKRKSSSSDPGYTIRRNTKNEIEQAINRYQINFDVEYLGELKNGEFSK